jgi:BioD-like phosphotransacetylase family protein
MSKYLLIASSEPYTGKSATIIGIAKQLQEKNINLGYAKPIGTCFDDKDPQQEEQDIAFIRKTLNLSESQVKSPLLFLNEKTINEYLRSENKPNYQESLNNYCQTIEGELVLIEGAGDLQQGNLFNLATPEIVNTLNAQVLLVVKYHPLLLIDQVLAAKKMLGDHLLGVLINSIPSDKLETVELIIKPFLLSKNIDVFGLLPSNNLLQSVSVRELVQQLNAKVLCREDRLDFMVQSLTVGAMNVNSALEYFRQRQNMAVVTGGDRTDLQLAALESSTNCLILTGNTPPQALILARAEDLEIPILSVNLDTLTTVEIVNQAFGKVRLQETIKVECIQDLIKQHFDLNLLISKLGLRVGIGE